MGHTRLGCIVALGLLAGTAASARSDDDAAAVDCFSHAFDDAQFRKDRAALDRMLAPDMIYINGSGTLAGRAAFLNAFSDRTERFEPFVIANRRLVPLGTDVVAVTADGAIRGTNAGGRFEEHFRYTDIFRRRGKAWQVVYVQVSRRPGS